MLKLRESAPTFSSSEAFTVEKVGAAPVRPPWQGRIGSTGV